MKRLLFGTDNSWTGLILRLTSGIVLLPHGAQKMLGWFGGKGFSATIAGFTEHMGLPWFLAFLVVATEFIGSICMIFGFLTRFWAIADTILMTVIIIMVHSHNGFFMNWQGTQAGEGFEYHLLFVGISLALIAVGGGRFSIDSSLSRKM